MKPEFPTLAWTQIWQVTFLALTVAILVRLFARNRPHLAFALWLVVLLKCVTPAIFANSAGIFCWIQAKPSALAKGPEAESNASPELPSAIDIHDSSFLLGAQALRGFEFHATNESVRKNLALDAVQIGLLALLGVWLLGGISLLIHSALRCRRCLSQAFSQLRDPQPALKVLFHNLVRKLRIRRPVQLVVTESLIGPAVVGVIRPTVLLPAAIVDANDIQDLEPILAHELVHVRRGDLWVGMLQVLTAAVWWFHPLVRMANRWTTIESERCCDEEVIGELGLAPGQYARSLLRVMEVKQTLRAVPVFPGIRPVDVTAKRLERVMKLGHGCHKRTPSWCWIVALFATVITLPGGALLLSAEENGKAKLAPTVLPGNLIAPKDPAKTKATPHSGKPTESITNAPQKQDGNAPKKPIYIQCWYLSAPIETIDGWKLKWQSGPQSNAPAARNMPQGKDKPASEHAQTPLESADQFMGACAIVGPRGGDQIYSDMRAGKVQTLCSPTLMVENSAEATIAMGQEMMVQSVSAEGKVVDKSQLIGMQFQLLPKLNENKSIETEVRVTETSIQSKTRMKFRVMENGKPKQVELELPIINTMEMQTKCVTPFGSCCVLRIRDEQKDGKQTARVLVINYSLESPMLPGTIKKPIRFSSHDGATSKESRLSVATMSPWDHSKEILGRTYSIVDYVAAQQMAQSTCILGERLDLTRAKAIVDTIAAQIQKDVLPESWERSGGDGIANPYYYVPRVTIDNSEKAHKAVASYLRKYEVKTQPGAGLVCRLLPGGTPDQVLEAGINLESDCSALPSPNSLMDRPSGDGFVTEAQRKTLCNSIDQAMDVMIPKQTNSCFGYLDESACSKLACKEIRLESRSFGDWTYVEVAVISRKKTDGGGYPVANCGYILRKGASLLLELPTLESEKQKRSNVPVLSGIPIVGSLFRNNVSSRCAYLLITPMD